MFKKMLLLATSVFLAVFVAHGQTSPTFDQYGGRMDVNCHTITPYFHLEKIGNRWWFCTPEGHAFTSMSVGGVGERQLKPSDASNSNSMKGHR